MPAIMGEVVTTPIPRKLKNINAKNRTRYPTVFSPSLGVRKGIDAMIIAITFLKNHVSCIVLLNPNFATKVFPTKIHGKERNINDAIIAAFASSRPALSAKRISTLSIRQFTEIAFIRVNHTYIENPRFCCDGESSADNANLLCGE
jgi:hypothetical protein